MSYNSLIDYTTVPFDTLLGKTLTRCEVIRGDYDDQIVFETTDGEQYKMFHDQDCCESVSIEDICGDLSGLIGSPLVQAMESSNSSEDTDGDSQTWTFYHLATVPSGSVTIRWYGTSNGYYSESVYLYKRKNQ